jgi:putative transposase
VCDAIFYVLKTGCQWRMVPVDFPPWPTVYHYFRRWSSGPLWGDMHDFLRALVRVRDGRNPEPTVGIIDSRTMKSSAQALDGVGYDGGKKTKGRKLHALVDAMGMLLGAVVHAADVQDRDGAARVFQALADRFPLLSTIYADGGYQGPRAATGCPADIVVVKRTEPGFVVLPKRWIVERTFAWISANRRLAKDYEGYARTVLAFVRLAMIRLMLRRIRP